MVSTIKNPQKVIKTTAQLYKTRNSLRPLRRKKSIRLTNYLRREASRIRRHKVPSRWGGRHFYLHFLTDFCTTSNCRRFSKLLRTRFRAVQRSRRLRRTVRHVLAPQIGKLVPQLRTKKVTLLTSLATAGYRPLSRPIFVKTLDAKSAKAKIASLLLRRKRYRYKKLALLFLKAKRLRWLQTTRVMKQKRPFRKKSPFVTQKMPLLPASSQLRRRAVALNSLRHLYRTQIHPSFYSKSVLLRRARTAGLLTRRQAKGRKLRSRKRGWLKLISRRNLLRRGRKLHRKVSKRSSARTRSALLAAASRPVRQHRHYRKLLLIRRVGIAIQQLRTLRPASHLTTVIKQQHRLHRVVGSWYHEMVRVARLQYKNCLTLPRKITQKEKKVGKLLLTPAALATLKSVSLYLPATLAALRKAGAKGTPEKGTTQVKLTLRKRHFIKPLTPQQSGFQVLYEQGSGTSQKVYTVERPTKRTTAHRARSKQQGHVPLSEDLTARDKYLRNIRNNLHTVTAQLKLVKARQTYTRNRARHVKRATAHLTRSIHRLERYLPSWTAPTPRRVLAALRYLSAIEVQGTLIPSKSHAPKSRHHLIRKYLYNSGLWHKQLYDLRPRLDTPAGMCFTRRSLRYKRRTVKRRRALVAKKGRKARRRPRKKLVPSIRKRLYQFTARSSSHTGRTIPWKMRSAHRHSLHRKLAVTRTLFKGLLRAEKLPVVASQKRERADSFGRALLYGLLRFTTTPQHSNQRLLLTPLASAVRHFLHRNTMPAVTVVRLLVLKALTIKSGVTDITKKEELLGLERRWLSTLLPKNGLKNKKARSTLSLSRRFLRYPLLAGQFKGTQTALRLKKIYRKKVRPLIFRRTLTALLSRLKPKRRYSQKLRTQLKSRRNRTLHRWHHIRRYRQARRFTTQRVYTYQYSRIRREERLYTQDYSVKTRREIGRMSYLSGWKTKIATTRKQGFSSIGVALQLTSRLQQERLRCRKGQLLKKTLPLVPRRTVTALYSRLDSIRLRAHKALLWKAPLPRRSAAICTSHAQPTHWYGLPTVDRESLLNHRRQEVRRLALLLPRGTGSHLPTLPPLLRRWRAIRTKRHFIAPLAILSQRGGKVVIPSKKLWLYNRRSRISRAAAHPRLPNFRTRVPRLRRKMKQAAETRSYRIYRLFHRRLFFRKNLLFMRRKSTRGYKEKSQGKLIPLRGHFPLANRPLRTRLCRSKPLRRSLRRRLANLRTQRQQPTHSHRIRTSTGRTILAVRPVPHLRKTWQRKYFKRALRKQLPATTKKVEIINRLLQQFKQLVDLRSNLIEPAQKNVPAVSIQTTVQLPRINKKSVTATRGQHRFIRMEAAAHRTACPLWSPRHAVYWLLRAQHRITRLRQVRFWHLRTCSNPARWNIMLRYRNRYHYAPRPLRVIRPGTLRRFLPTYSKAKCAWYMRSVRAGVSSAVHNSKSPHKNKDSDLNNFGGASRLPTTKQKTTITKAPLFLPQLSVASAAVPTKMLFSMKAPVRIGGQATTAVTPALTTETEKSTRLEGINNSPANLDPELAKKVKQFYREADTHSQPAYTALMSGVKMAWTKLSNAEQDNNSPLTKKRQADTSFMVTLYLKHYEYLVKITPRDPNSIPTFAEYGELRKEFLCRENKNKK